MSASGRDASRRHGPGTLRLSAELERWQAGDRKTLGSLIDAFGEKSFAVVFVVLLAVPALPLPTGGATHLLEVVAMLLALQLIVGRDEIWMPRRWREMQLAGDKRERLIARLIGMIRWLERHSRPRARFLFGHRPGNTVFGVLVLVGAAAAFVAPPFSALDTLPALGVVVLSLGVLLEDVVVAAAGIAIAAGGIGLIVVLGRAALGGIGDLVSQAPAVTSLLAGRRPCATRRRRG